MSKRKVNPEVDEIKEGSKTTEEVNELDVIEDLEVDDGEIPEPPANPREEAMKRMVDNSADEREESRKEFIEASGGVIPNVEELETGEYAEPEINDKELDNPVENQNNPIIERDGMQYIQLKVNGAMQEMPVDQAVVYLQKNENADQKLAEAHSKNKQYSDLIAQQELQATSQGAIEVAAVDTQEALKGALTKVYDGELEEAAEDLGKLLQPTAQNSQSQASVEEQVSIAMAKAKNYESLKSAYDNFVSNEDFKHIAADDELMRRINTFTEVLQSDSEFMSTKPTYEDFFTEAGNRVQNWLDKVSGKSPKAPSTNNDSRLQRKRLTPSQPASRTVRRGPKVEENPYQKSNSDIVRQMAKRRGQTNL